MTNQWWPQKGAPPGTQNWPQSVPVGDGQSGKFEFTSANTSAAGSGADGDPPPAVIRHICALDLPSPAPVVVSVASTISEGGSVNGSQTKDFIAWAPASASYGTDSNMGFIVLSYGMGAAFKHMVCDLRNATYQLPPVVQIRLTATVYFWTGQSFLQPVAVTGCIARGFSGGQRPTYTQCYDVAAAGPSEVVVPDFASDVDCWTSQATVGAGKPVLDLNGGSAQAQPLVHRDYTTGIWAPPYRAQLVSGGSLMSLSTTVDCTAYVQFGLEL